MISDQPFGQWIKQRRRSLDLTQAELAARIGCSVSLLQKLEEGARRPSKQMAELLATSLELAEDEKPAFRRAARAPDIEEPPAPWTTIGALAPDARPIENNLPLPLTPLIGRSDDVGALCALLDRADVRLVTITGTAGVGKTRLSLEVAHQALTTKPDLFADGIWFVPLAAIDEPALVLPAIAHLLGLTQAETHAAVARLAGVLRGQKMLFLLDNFEQVVEAAADVSELLTRCPQIKVLATSRAPLLVRGEYQVALAPFSVPSLDALGNRLVTADAFAVAPAVQLFVATVQRFDPTFALTAANAPAIQEICSRLDGVALAIELAAARLRQFSVEELLAHLRRPEVGALALLAQGGRDLPPRHRSLHAALAWSYQLLDRAAQRLFAIGGVFAGGFTYAALRHVALPPGVDAAAVRQHQDLLGALQSLLDQSLLQKEEAQGHARYLMLDTIRHFAAEQLHAGADERAIRARHAGYFHQLARGIEAETSQRTRAYRYLQMVDEQPNLRAALHWLIETEPYEGLCMANTLLGFWHGSGSAGEGRLWYEAAIAANPQPSTAQAEAWFGLAFLANLQGDLAGAEAAIEQAFELFKALGDEHLLAECLLVRGLARYQAQQYADAEHILREALPVALAAGKRGLAAEIQLIAADARRKRGHYDAAVRGEMESVIAAAEEAGDLRTAIKAAAMLTALDVATGESSRVAPHTRQLLAQAADNYDNHTLGLAAYNLGDLARLQGERETAAAHYQTALRAFAKHGDSSGMTTVTIRLGNLAEACGLWSEAIAHYRQALELAQSGNRPHHQARTLLGLAEVTWLQGDVEAALRWLAELQRLLAGQQTLLAPQDRESYRRLEAQIRAA